MQLEEFLERSAECFPAKCAVNCGRRLTYAEVETQCNRLAHALIASGINRGDRVAILLDNSIQCVLSIFAVLKAGGVFVPLNPTIKGDKLAYILNDCGVACLITDPVKLERLNGQDVQCLRSIFAIGLSPDFRSNIGCVVEDFDAIAAAAGNECPPAKNCIDIDLAALIYTSGSTGRPKGVMLTHLNMTSAATSITTYLENTCDDIIINVLPLSFDYGLYQVLMAFKVGATVVLETSYAYPYAMIETLKRESITGFPIVPTLSAILLKMDLAKSELPRLRYITNTAAALPVEHIRKLRAMFPNVKLYSMYGLTECKRVSYLPPEQIDVRPGSVGKAMPNEEVYLVDESGARVPNGSTGELVIRGSNVMKGYWGLPDESARRLKPGPLPGEFVLYSGDLFRTDEEGYLYFIARKDEIIKSRGEKISPKEVEEAIYALPGVSEVCVFAVPDEVMGSAISAAITLEPGVALTERDVVAHCKSRLEDFMVPKFVHFHESLPKTSTGKVSRRDWRLQAEEKSCIP